MHNPFSTMNTLSRIFAIFVAFLSVSALGYYAYSLSSQTLTFPFRGTETQYGYALQIPVTPPRLHFSWDDILLDTGAVLRSLTRNGIPLDEAALSGEYRIMTSKAYIQIEDVTPNPKDPPLILSSTLYNEQKSTPYILPRDITLTPTDIPRDLSFISEWDPRDQKYNITLYGLWEYSPDEIRYYAHYEDWLDCSIMSWWSPSPYTPYNYIPKGTPVSGEVAMTYTGDLSPWIWKEISPRVLTPSSRDGQRWVSQVALPYDLSAWRLCIIAGVAWSYRIIEDRWLEDFTATGSVIASLSPEYDMKSRVEFRFSHDIYRDIGSLYSPEYIAHRRDAKIDFLKHFSIIPNIDVSPDDIVFTPDRAILTLPLKEWEKYTIWLKDIRDIYGRSASIEYQTTLQAKPFLSLRLGENKQIYTPNEQIPAKLYSLLPARNSYTLKLCRLELDTYARVERILSDRTLQKNAGISQILDSHEASDCRKKDVVITPDGYVSPFFVSDFFLWDTSKNGLYMLSFADPSVTSAFDTFISPILFSIVDTHLTLKVDASGKMQILATDISTGKPRSDMEVTLMRNISRTHTEKWDPLTGKTENIYLPLTMASFATGIVIWRTDSIGKISTKKDTLIGIDGYDSSPYGLSFESWWEYEGRYESFIVQAKSSTWLWYLVSTWNDGITGYNFGIKDSDYSYENRPNYTAYVHTDRKLYLPGEKAHLHAIIRQNTSTLSIPTEQAFDLIINDPLGREIKRSTLKPNQFGSIGVDYEIPKDAPLGLYNINLIATNSSEYIEYGFSNFQVEIFKNPTFTATVELKSPDLQNDMIRDLRRIPNTDPYTPWYTDVYSGNLTIEWVIKAAYYNGATLRNTPFTYRVYRSEAFDDTYFSDCFWWCYYEPPLEHYTDWSGSIDSDGYGIIRVPVDFQSFYSDYRYTIEVTIRDPLTGEEVTTPGSLIVKLPEAYKSFSPENPIIFTPKKKILTQNESLLWEVKPQYGKWDSSLIGKYSYEIVSRRYQEVMVDDIRAGQTRVTTSVDTVVASGTIDTKDISLKSMTFAPGEYHFRTTPIIESWEAPASSISDTIFYIAGDLSTLQDNTLRVIPDKTIYKAGETARVLIQTPFTGSYLYITREKWWVIDSEYVYLSGNTLLKEYRIDDSMVPNAYIGVVALRPLSNPWITRTYAVWYGEIITDLADKKWSLSIKTDKSTYKNREIVTADMTLTDRSGNPLQWEVTMMVVDESLIRLLGNIDLDIIAKFYHKYPFTVKTALSAIGIERNRFLSRKGSNGGGGDKWGAWDQIASRTLFENTAYYNPSIETDISGKARITFTLPDNVTDYRIITIANTRDSKFAVAEKTIEVRKDYVLESAAPMIIRNKDTFTLTATAYNHTKRITPTEVVLKISTWATYITKKFPLSLGVDERKSVDFTLEASPLWIWDTISYTLELREWDRVLDSITKTIARVSTPSFAPKMRSVEIFSGTTYTYTLPKSLSPLSSPSVSNVEITLSSYYGEQIGRGISSLLQYPYGCIEQTIASTLPNRIALSLADILSLSIDKTKATDHTKKWLQKILDMQHFSGGWTYWEWATEANIHITPYVLRSLQKFQELWEYIPQAVYENGIWYIILNESEYKKNPDDFAEAVWTLASFRDPRAAQWWSEIDIKRLSRHWYVAYAYAAQKLGKYTESIDTTLRAQLDSTSDDWYSTRISDRALYADLLLDRQDKDWALKILDPIIRSLDLGSYYVSTYEKIHTLLALIRLSKDVPKISKDISIALRWDILIADLPLRPGAPTNTITSTREKIGDSYTLKRDDKKIPLYVTTIIHDIPKNPVDIEAFATGSITIRRTYEQIDESKWIDESGEFIIKKPITNAIFQKGKLYKVTLRATLPKEGRRHISIEDFFPGGWRPINGIFKTEQSAIGTIWWTWWDHIESREDKLLAYREYLFWDESALEYAYYIRPESVWEYLLPPATAYLMYTPEYHAYTSYTRVTVVP